MLTYPAVTQWVKYAEETFKQKNLIIQNFLKSNLREKSKILVRKFKVDNFAALFYELIFAHCVLCPSD